MKTIFTLFTLVLATAFTARAELSIVSAEHRSEDSFKRLSEYLTGEPSEGRYSVFRSAPERREGFYVSLFEEDRSMLNQVATVRIHFVRAGTQEVETREMPAGSIKKKRLLVGLTEEEWSDEEARPVAWKIELLDERGQTLDEVRSFLWSD